MSNYNLEIARILDFVLQIVKAAGKSKVIVGVSGGIDSALSLTLATQALGAENVIAIMLPYGEQDIVDGQKIIDFNQLVVENQRVINIKPIVDIAAQVAEVDLADKVRLGNLMARTRMMILYDLAKKVNALVCGTENKSEKYLGYFTRFGDEASDLEPLVHLYKTQVRELARELNLPPEFTIKAPSAGLWDQQTDEQELGFSYELADQVLKQLIDEKKDVAEIKIDGVEPELIAKVIQRVEQMQFKQQVPYFLKKI